MTDFEIFVEKKAKYQKILESMPLADEEFVIDVVIRPISESISEGLVVVEQKRSDSEAAAVLDRIFILHETATEKLNPERRPEKLVNEEYLHARGAHRMDIINPFGKSTFTVSYLILPKGDRQLMIVITAPDPYGAPYEQILASLKHE